MATVTVRALKPHLQVENGLWLAYGPSYRLPHGFLACDATLERPYQQRVFRYCSYE